MLNCHIGTALLFLFLDATKIEKAQLHWLMHLVFIFLGRSNTTTASLASDTNS